MESSEWPNAMMIATARNLRPDRALEPAQAPPALKCRLLRQRAPAGAARGRAAACVSGHQIRKATTITVVICMMRSALPLDSWMPLMLLHQK